MKPLVRALRSLIACSLLATPALLHAQSTGHYVGGLEGIKAASLPPPGVYVRDYNLFYSSTRLNDASGNRIAPANPDIFTFVNAPRIIWITDKKLLGGYLGVDALIPFIYQSVEVSTPFGRFDDNTFGVGDLFGEVTLSWHTAQFDFSLGAGAWAPTGDSDAPPTTNPGAGFWTTMLTAGATWYLDAEKTWSVSALGRYEFNGEQRDTDITPGDAFTLEWGAAKTFQQIYDVGVVGYYQRQTTGGNVNGSMKLGSVAAIGPEIGISVPKLMFSASVRYLHEFASENRTQGETFSLTLTKRF